MATHILPPTHPIPPPPEILAPESFPIHDFHENLVEAARTLKQSLMRIAYYGFRMRLEEGWCAFGLEPGTRGEDAYREQLGVPRSTWYKYVRIGQSLHQLSLADLERIPVTNAELLIQVNPVLWHDYAWVREAQTLSPRRLAEVITLRNRTSGDDREPLVGISFRVPFLAKQAIEGMIDEFQHKHQLTSRTQALELWVADQSAGSSLLGAVEQARKLIDGVFSSGRGRGNLNPEQFQWLTLAKEVLDAGYEKAIQTSRAKANGNQEGRQP